MRMPTRMAMAALALGLSVPASQPARAQAWPAKQITMVIPFAAGGPVDTVGRLLGQYLGEVLGQQLVMENVGGAGGMIAAARVAKAEPDGYTLLLSGSATLALNQAIYKKPLVDGTRDFTHVALFADSARLLLVHKDFPVRSLREFIAHAKANVATLQYGSAGVGSGAHVCAVLLDGAIGAKITHVPYRGTALAMQDLVAGRLHYVAEQISTAVGHVQGGSMRAIAVMGLERSPVLPDVPTAAEEGFKSLDCNSWASLSFPKGVAAAVVQRLASAVDRALEQPALKERYEKIGVSIPAKARRTPEFIARFVPEEIERWGAAIRGAGISSD